LRHVLLGFRVELLGLVGFASTVLLGLRYVLLGLRVGFLGLVGLAGPVLLGLRRVLLGFRVGFLGLAGLARTVLLGLRNVLPRFRVGLLELAGVVLVFGMVLPIRVGVIRVGAGGVNVAKAAVAKAARMEAAEPKCTGACSIPIRKQAPSVALVSNAPASFLAFVDTVIIDVLPTAIWGSRRRSLPQTALFPCLAAIQA
jgi:hypothetical protein